MFFPDGEPIAHDRAGALLEGESVQSVATSANGALLAVVSQLQLHLWSGARDVVHMASVRLPGANLEEDAAQYILFHPHHSNHLVAVTARRVLFYEVGASLSDSAFLRPVNGSTGPHRLQYRNAASRVCFTTAVSIETGLVSCVASAGTCAILVGTTAGLVCMVGWRQQSVLHSWSMSSLCTHPHRLSFPSGASGSASDVPKDTLASSVASRLPEGAAAEAMGSVPSPTLNADLTDPPLSTPSPGAGGMAPSAVVPPGVVRVAARQQQHSSRLLPLPEIGAADSPSTPAARSSATALPTQPQHRESDVNAASAATGAILHATFAPRLKLFSFVLSSGYVLLATSSCGAEFTAPDVRFHGHLTPSVFASTTCVNTVHRLIAVATHSGGVSCRPFCPRELTIGDPLWRNLRCVEEVKARLGAVSCMQWSPHGEEMLCVGFSKGGVAVLHYSGACVMTSLQGDVPLTRQLSVGRPPAASLLVSGCVSATWSHGGTRLTVVEPRSTRFLQFAFARVVAGGEVGPSFGRHSSVALCGAEAVHLMNCSEADGPQGVSDVVPALDTYLAANYPLRYGAISSDGSNIVCAGSHGCAVFNRDSRSWNVFKDEHSRVCVTDPIWLGSVAVVLPFFIIGPKRYELAVVARDNLSIKGALVCIELERRPQLLSSSMQDAYSCGFIVVVDTYQMLSVLRYDISTSNTCSPKGHVAASLTHICSVSLDNTALSHPLSVQPMCQGGLRETSSMTSVDVPHLLFHRRDDHSLAWLPASAIVVRGNNAAPSTSSVTNADYWSSAVIELGSESDRAIRPTKTRDSQSRSLASPRRRVFNYWCDRSSPLDGMTLVVWEDAGLSMYYSKWPPHTATKATLKSAELHQLPITVLRDVELIPLCVSPFDGYVLCAAEAYERGTGGSERGLTAMVSRLAVRPVLYTHRVLAALLQLEMPSPDVAQFNSTAPPGSGGAMAGVGEPGAHRSPATSSAPPLTSYPSCSGGSAAHGSHVGATFIWDRQLFYWLQQLRESGTFVATMDYFLHTVINEQPPAGVKALDHKSAIRSTLLLLRRYPEFYRVVVECLRKIDVPQWRLVLDFIGPPLEFYRECIASNRLSEAVHLVRVIMMGTYNTGPGGGSTVATSSSANGGISAGAVVAAPAHQLAQTPSGDGRVNEGMVTNSAVSQGETCSPPSVDSLMQACACAIQLFELSLANGEYSSAYDLIRFMALLRHEAGMPAAVEVVDEDDSTTLLGRWLRRLSGVPAESSRAVAAADYADVLLYPSLRLTSRGDAGVNDAPMVVREQEEGASRSESGGGVAASRPRLSAMMQMFIAYPELPRAVDAEAGRLLERGYVLQLCQLMATFSLSLQHFLAVRVAAEHRRAPDLEALTVTMDGIHISLGLPRSGRHIGVTAAEAYLRPYDGSGSGEEAQLLRFACRDLWSGAQCVLYGTPGALGGLLTVRRLYAPLLKFNILLNMLLMSKVDMIRALTPDTLTSRKAGEADRVEGTGGSIEWMSALERLVSQPAYWGYRAFYQDVIESLPPNLLSAAAAEQRTEPTVATPGE